MGTFHKIRSLFRRNRVACEVEEELQYHLAMRENMNRREGMTQTEARLAAQRSFGNVTLIKEKTSDVNVLVFLETVFKDIHFGARMLAKHRGFAILAVLALAVGIGVNTAVFTACKAVLLQPLDAKNAEQLVNVYRSTAQHPYVRDFSYPDFEFFQEHNRPFSGVVAASGGELTMSSGPDLPGPAAAGGGLAQAFGFHLLSPISGSSEFVSVSSVSENYFAVLGVNAIRGRVFLPQDARDLDAHPAILISENFWQRRFAGNPSVLGRVVKLNGMAVTIIGITPHDFVGTILNVPNVWLPMRLWPLVSKNPTFTVNREDTCCALYGRLADGVSSRQAQAEMTLLESEVRSLHAPDSEGSQVATISLTPGSHIGPVHMLQDTGLVFALLLILGAVGLVLLIACANVGSLQLARAASRQKEIGVRISIGASRSRVIRQLLTESALLGLLAGAAALLLTWWALRLLMTAIAASLPLEWGAVALHVEPDLTVFVYVFALSLLASILFGLAPAIQASRPNVSSALKEEGSSLGLRLSNSRLRDLLMGSQAAAALFLLIGASLLIRGSIRSMAVNPGYETKSVVFVDLNFPEGLGYSHEKQLAEINHVMEKLSDLPGINSVAMGYPPDGGGLRTASVGLNGNQPVTGKLARGVFYAYVTPAYFKCLGIPAIQGQTFPASSSTVVLSESAASELWPGESAVGKTVALDASNDFHTKGQLIPQGGSYQVIAVVKDTRAITPQGDDNRKAYLLMPADKLDGGFPILIRFQSDSRVILAEVGRRVKAVDPSLVVYAGTVDDLLTSTPTFTITRLSAIFASLIGGLGLLLACVGIYGTVSYAVARRTREVGIRMALGAGRSSVLRLIMLESGQPVLLGLIAGTLAAAGASQLLHSLLFGLSSFDPMSFFSVGALFLLIALLAAYVPARRAAQVDPVVALRCD